MNTKCRRDVAGHRSKICAEGSAGAPATKSLPCPSAPNSTPSTTSLVKTPKGRPMDLQNLNDQVHQLTRPHRTTYIDPERGSVTYRTEVALFEQLRQEQASGNRAGGGGASGSGSRSPVAIQALMLWMEIHETLNTRHVAITGRDDHSLAPEAKLQKWGPTHSPIRPARKL